MKFTSSAKDTKHLTWWTKKMRAKFLDNLILWTIFLMKVQKYRGSWGKCKIGRLALLITNTGQQTPRQCFIHKSLHAQKNYDCRQAIFFTSLVEKKLSHLLADYFYCLFSSDSHPDLLVTQQHPHFFRSHRSSISTFTFWATTAISMQYHAITCNNMLYRAISCNTVQY